MARLLITAGPTHEYLDDVRFLANASSGRMGYAIAAAGATLGHEVLLISGPTALPTPANVERVDVVSAREMRDRSAAAFADRDIAFGVAAVADFRPARRHRGKPAKSELPGSIELVPNPDVIATLGELRGARQVVVGFALESFDPAAPEAAIERAAQKLARKRLDLCVLNPAETMGATVARVFVIDAGGLIEAIGPADKEAIAMRLVSLAVARLEQKAASTEEASG